MADRARRKTAGRRPKIPAELLKLSKEELFAKLNASAQRTLDSLMKAYEAGSREGFEAGEEEQVIELLKRAKALRDEVRRITEENA
jgi:hypothetical protein